MCRHTLDLRLEVRVGGTETEVKDNEKGREWGQWGTVGVTG